MPNAFSAFVFCCLSGSTGKQARYVYFFVSLYLANYRKPRLYLKLGTGSTSYATCLAALASWQGLTLFSGWQCFAFVSINIIIHVFICEVLRRTLVSGQALRSCLNSQNGTEIYEARIAGLIIVAS